MFMSKIVVGGIVASSIALAGCAGLIAGDPSGPSNDSGRAAVDSVSDVYGVPDVYGAQYQGDAGACATVICSGAQVCCVLPVPSDAATPYPNNKCDYNCVALCMDSCPAVSQAGIDAAPSLAPGTHGGGIAAPPAADDAGSK
jgi:hypothetical protein